MVHCASVLHCVLHRLFKHKYAALKHMHKVAGGYTERSCCGAQTHHMQASAFKGASNSAERPTS